MMQRNELILSCVLCSRFAWQTKEKSGGSTTEDAYEKSTGPRIRDVKFALIECESHIEQGAIEFGGQR